MHNDSLDQGLTRNPMETFMIPYVILGISLQKVLKPFDQLRKAEFSYK